MFRTESTSGVMAKHLEGNKNASKYDPTNIVKAIKAFSLGATISQAADYVGVSRQTLSRWIDENEDFAMEVAKARSHFAIGELNPELKKKDPFKYLKALYPEDFKDSPQVAVQVNQEISMLSDDELEKKVKQILESSPTTE